MRKHYLGVFAVVSLNLCNVLISNRSSGKQQSLVSYIPYKYGYVHGMHCKVYEASDMHFRVFGGKDLKLSFCKTINELKYI